jgi:hypothetical protein
MLMDKGVDAKATAGGKGQFDVVRDGEVVFSKYVTGRFPEEAEVASLAGV